MLAGIKYVIKNLFKVIVLILTLWLLLSNTPEDITNPDNAFMSIILLFFLCINVSTVYDFGEFYVIFSEAGVSLAVGLIGYFLLQWLLVWLVTNGVVIAGILIILYAVNRLIDAIKFAEYIPLFFNIVGFAFAAIVLIDGIVLMSTGFDFDAIGSFLFIVNIPVVILQLINLFVHASEADGMDD